MVVVPLSKSKSNEVGACANKANSSHWVGMVAAGTLAASGPGDGRLWRCPGHAGPAGGGEQVVERVARLP